MAKGLRKVLDKVKNSRVRKSGKTKYCGVTSERIRTPEKAARTKGDYFCIICGSSFTRAESINYHFPGCVERYGNPDGNHWNDHHSCKNTGRRGNDVGTGATSSAAYTQELKHQEEAEQDREEQEEEDEVPIQFNPTTIASDFLRVLGEHPTLPPLSAHMEGCERVSEPPARPRPRLRLRSPKPPTEASHAPHRPHSLRQHQGDDWAGRVGAEEEAAAAEGNPGMENEEAKRKARTQADEEFNSMRTRPSQSSLRQNPRSDSASNQAPLASQPVALLSGWEMRSSNRGIVYFVNHHTQILTVDDPRVSTQPRPLSRIGGLPSGWDISLTNTTNGPRVYFLDRNNKTTTWIDPRGLS